MATITLTRKIEPGIKRLKILSIDEKFGPSGYTYLTMQMEITRGPEKTLTFAERLSLSPQARFRVNQFLDAIAAPDSGSVDSGSFVGKYLWATVKIDDSREIVSPVVEKYLLPGDVDQGPEDEEDIAEEEASLKAEAFEQATIAELADDDDDPFNVPLTTETNGKKGKKARKKEEEEEETADIPF